MDAAQRSHMSELLRRLAHLTRAQVYDFLGRHFPGASSAPPWDADTATQAESDSADFGAPFEAPAGAGHGLPYSAELARCYALLDLPFGAPLRQVTRRWKAYVKKSHPDLYAHDPAKQADATELTQQLNGAYAKIKAAWEHHQS
jgi:hypothetical protein